MNYLRISMNCWRIHRWIQQMTAEGATPKASDHEVVRPRSGPTTKSSDAEGVRPRSGLFEIANSSTWWCRQTLILSKLNSWDSQLFKLLLFVEIRSQNVNEIVISNRRLRRRTPSASDHFVVGRLRRQTPSASRLRRKTRIFRKSCFFLCFFVFMLCFFCVYEIWSYIVICNLRLQKTIKPISEYRFSVSFFSVFYFGFSV